MTGARLTVNGEAMAIGHCPPAQTLLRFLRSEAGLCGTKEGCASGDCGACTVLVAELGEAPQVINSCITLLGSVAGQQVVTVEGLAGDDGSGESRRGRHPVQTAMVECHGSQCGFCTPGFVMALAGLYERGGRGETAVREAIAGNLCRCTGYRPILEAGRRMYDYPPAPVMHETGAGDKLTPQADAGPALPAGYHRPRSEAALQALLREHPDAWLLAGGTDAALELTQRYADPPVVVDLSAVAELRRCTDEDGCLIVGGAVSCSELEARFADRSPALVTMLHRFGSQQIRNRATPGGNLAGGSPIADLPPVLLCWDAEVEIGAASGERRRLPVAEFHRGYRDTVLGAGEYVASVHLPHAALARPHRIYKISKRHEDDISTVLGAFSIGLEGARVRTARIAYGGMAATPARVPAAEALLEGTDLDAAAIDSACDAVSAAFTPLDDVRASAAYRSAMAAALLRRALLELRDGADLSIDAVAPLVHA